VSKGILDPTAATVTVTGSGAAPATPGQDVGTPAPTQISFGVGADTKPIQVPITDDGLDEADETFTVTVTSTDGSTTGSTTTTITDNDVTIDATPATVTEGGAATVTLTPRAAPAH